MQISLLKKENVLLLFFLLRKLILPLYSFLLMCVILPLTMFIPEAKIPVWMIFHVPLVMAILNIYLAPGSFPFVLPYLFFENTMAVTKFHTMISGLLQLRNSYEWVVTKKPGRSGESDQKVDGVADTSAEAAELKRLKEAPLLITTKSNEMYKKELALALLLMVAAMQGLLSALPVHFYLLLFQGLAFLIVGLDLLGGQFTAL